MIIILLILAQVIFMYNPHYTSSTITHRFYEFVDQKYPKHNFQILQFISNSTSKNIAKLTTDKIVTFLAPYYHGIGINRQGYSCYKLRL